MYSHVAYFSRVIIDELGYPIDTFFPTSKMWRCEINNFLARAMWGIGTKCFPYPTEYNEKRVKSHGWILNPQKDPNAIRRTKVNGRFYSHIVDWMEYDMKRQQQPSQKRQKLERLYFDGSK